MARKTNDDEKLDDATLERVIAYLKEKGATKKAACGMMNISYNTTRLDKLIEMYLKRKEDNARRRKEKVGKPATKEEISYVITEYLSGNTITDISKSIYRGTTFVHSILRDYAVPERNTSVDYFRPKMIPEEAVRIEFAVGETVYSARYDTLAKIVGEKPHKEGKVYQVWLKGDWQQFAYQPAWELASLAKLREEGIVV